MKRPVWAILGAIGLSIVITIAWQTLSKPKQNPKVVLQQTDEAAAQAKPSQPSSKKPAKPDTQEPKFNPYDSEELKANIQQVADLYEENAKYPNNSQPIYDPSAVTEPEPFEFTEVDLPFPEGDDDDKPLRIAAATDTYQYFIGDVISIRVQLSGAPQDTFADVSGVLSGANGDLPFALNFEAQGETLNTFYAQFDTKIAPVNLLSPEMLAKIKVTVDGRELFTTVAFRIDQASARIVGVLPAQPQGPNLLIPLQINVNQNGYYFVKAVLEDAQERRPLIELQQEGRLQFGNGILNLNAHIAALKRQGSEGPYILRSLKLYRGAEVNESYDQPGSSSQRAYSVQGFPFSAYANEAYTDEEAQERIDFLRDIGKPEQESNSP